MGRSISRQLYWAGYRYVARQARTYGEAEALVRSVERSGCPGHFKLGARRALRKLVPVPGEIW